MRRGCFAIICAKSARNASIVKFNWKQSGMPASLVSRIGLKSKVAEFKTVLNDAQSQVMMAVDAEAMARELVESGGSDYMEMVRALSADLANARKELEAANRRYERLVADLARRGISVDENPPEPARPKPVREPASEADGLAEWEDWDRRFKSLLEG